ncbi:MAG: hypothetical protein J0L66_12445 [Cytophagales bacterium]|nr:hypothetical protein [Cytophagales bacterium]
MSYLITRYCKSYVFIYFFLLILSVQFQTYAQSHSKIELTKQKQLRETGRLPSHINEASGLAITSAGKFWTHNDDGIAVLFCVDSTGSLINSIHINSLNNGWEDLAMDSLRNIYIGAFGNNQNDRRDLKILKIANPEFIKTPVALPDIINFSYEDQVAFPPPLRDRNFDADAMIVLGNYIYIFTKNRTVPFTGFTKVYRLPNQPGDHIAVLTDSLFLGNDLMMNNWVTGAALSPDRSTVALLGHSRVWLISGFTGHQFSTGKITKLELDSYTHKAGIAFRTNTQLYIVDEKEMGILGGKIYYLELR